MYNRIAVVAEDSPRARAALAHALALATKTPGAALRFIVPFEVPVILTEQKGVDAATYADQSREEAGMLLDEFRTVARRAGIEPDGVLIDCSTTGYARRVASDAEKWKADTIVLGEAKRRGLARFLGRSLATEISKATSIAVTSVP